MGNNLPNLYSLDRFLPSTLGFDRVFDLLDFVSDASNNSNLTFPPTNIIRLDDRNYTLELAVAGFKKEEIEITLDKNSLLISGKKSEKDEKQYLVKGIAGRSFARSFVVLDTIVVKEASLQDGILSVHLQNLVPEETKTKKINIK